MKEAISTIKDMYSQFFDGGSYIILFLVALLYIFFIKKEENEKIKIFLWSSLIYWIIILNPIVYKILEPIFSGGVYWRMFWLLPISVVIPFVATDLIYRKENFFDKAITFIAIAVIIILSGKCVFNKDNFEKAPNHYKLPQEAIEVAKIISEDEKSYKLALVPETMVAYIRQYDSNINLRYARNPHSYDDEPMVLALYSGQVDQIIEDSNKFSTNYVVFRKETKLVGSMEDAGFKVLEETANYIIYSR